MRLSPTANPALPETTACYLAQAGRPISPAHPRLTSGQEDGEHQGVVGRSRAFHGRALVWPVSLGLSGRPHRVLLPTPPALVGGEGKRTILRQTQYPAPPQPSFPPNNNQRKIKRCHLPMPALRVSEPSGMGGARQLLGAWRGAGFPGGGHGTAYLEPPSLPEHAHGPHTPPPVGGAAKATGKASGVLGTKGRTEPRCLETGRKAADPKTLRVAWKGGDGLAPSLGTKEFFTIVYKLKNLKQNCWGGLRNSTRLRLGHSAQPARLRAPGPPTPLSPRPVLPQAGPWGHSLGAQERGHCCPS